MTCSRWVTICADIADHPVVGVKSGAWMGWWIYLIANVNWRERAVHHKGRALSLKRGQMLAGRAYLAREWGCSEKQVRSFLATLEKHGMIEKVQSKGHFANVITICNYDAYQQNSPSEGQCEGQSRASERPEKGQTLTRVTTVTREQDSTDSYHQEQTYADGVGAPALELQVPKPKLTQTEVAKRCAEIYNQHAERHGYSKVLKLNEERIKNIFRRTHEFVEKGATLEDHIAVWERALGVAEKSSFLRGQTNTPFQMTIDFLCQKSSFLKVLEGKYGNGADATMKVIKKDLTEWNARQQAALERQLRDLEFEP